MTSKKKELDEKISSLDQETKKLNNQINESKEKLAQQETIRRNIADNVKYRNQLSKIKEMEIKIRDKEKNNSPSDMESLEKELTRFQKDFDSLKSQVNLIEI